MLDAIARTLWRLARVTPAPAASGRPRRSCRGGAAPGSGRGARRRCAPRPPARCWPRPALRCWRAARPRAAGGRAAARAVGPGAGRWCGGSTSRLAARVRPLSDADRRCLRDRGAAHLGLLRGPCRRGRPPPAAGQRAAAAGGAHCAPHVADEHRLALLAPLAARDLGLAAADAAARRASGATLDTLEQLERYRGHFFNWYDTLGLLPLAPRYVSTVDSGNLCAVAAGAAQPRCWRWPTRRCSMRAGAKACATR